MSPALFCLIGFTAWTILLIFALGITRITLILTGQAMPDSFTAGIKHGGEMYWRLNRAHMNAVENLPIFGAIVLTGALMNLQDFHFNIAAQVVLGARILQSIFHISSGRNLVIQLRFLAYLTQLIAMGSMIYILL